MSMIHGASVKTLYGGLYAYTGARNWNWVGNFKSAYFCPVNYFDRFKSIPQENQKMKSQNFFCIVLGGFDTCFISAFKATFEFNVGERAIWRSNFCANRKLLDLKLPIYILPCNPTLPYVYYCMEKSYLVLFMLYNHCSCYTMTVPTVIHLALDNCNINIVNQHSFLQFLYSPQNHSLMPSKASVLSLLLFNTYKRFRIAYRNAI